MRMDSLWSLITTSYHLREFFLPTVTSLNFYIFLKRFCENVQSLKCYLNILKRIEHYENARGPAAGPPGNPNIMNTWL